MVGLVKATSCPKCGSTDTRRRSVYSRKIRVLYGVETFLVTQYCCRQCHTTFTDSIDGVKKGCHVAEEVKRKALDIYMGGPDTEEVMKRLREDLKVQISVSTIWRFLYSNGKVSESIDIMETLKPKTSKFICVDEKFISAHGKKKPIFTGLCPQTDIPVVKKLIRDREERTVLPMFKRFKRLGFEVCISDDWKAYPAAAKKVGMRHQKCHFHAKQAVTRILRKKHIQKKRKEKFERWLFEFIDSKSLKEAKIRLRVIGKIKKEKKLQRFMKSFLYNWPDYFTYLEFEGCPKTNNPSENHNRRFEQKRQTMHGFRKERTARSFIALFSLHSVFRKFEAGINKGIAPIELAGRQLIANSIYDILPS